MLGAIASLYYWLRPMLVRLPSHGTRRSWLRAVLSSMKGLMGGLNGSPPSPSNFTASTEVVQKDPVSRMYVPMLVTDMQLSDTRGSKKETTRQINIRSWSPMANGRVRVHFYGRSWGPQYSHQAIICFLVSPPFDVSISQISACAFVKSSPPNPPSPSPSLSPSPSPGPIPWGTGVDKPPYSRGRAPLFSA